MWLQIRLEEKEDPSWMSSVRSNDEYVPEVPIARPSLRNNRAAKTAVKI
jgi:hypothetical protein